MFHRDDTVVAIATPPGRGGLGVVRVSGPRALEIARSLAAGAPTLEPRRATVMRVRGAAELLDQAVATFFPAPHSYTGEHTVEISAHGSQVVLRGILKAAMAAGARLAEPGEFTFRAFLNGKLDLVQAEAVRDLVDAVTPLQARAAFDQLQGTLTRRIAEIDASLLDLSARLEASMDFPEEGYHFISPAEAASELQAVESRLRTLLAEAARGRIIREGAQVVLLGRPNAGKSSLFNALAGADRAIVTPVPGTTRDLVTEKVDIDGLAITVVDTAGLRGEAVDVVEAEGMSRSRSAGETADLALVVIDAAAALASEDLALLDATYGKARLVLASKADLPRVAALPVESLAVSAHTGLGLADLRRAIAERLLSDGRPDHDVPAITNARHAALVARARDAVSRAAMAAEQGTPEEFVAEDVHEARAALEEITGARTPDDVLRVIFERFCIGK